MTFYDIKGVKNLYVQSNRLNNKELMTSVLKNAYLLDTILNSGNCELRNDYANTDLSLDCCQQLISFMSFFLGEGYKNKSVLHILSPRELAFIADVTERYCKVRKIDKRAYIIFMKYASSVRDLNIVYTVQQDILNYFSAEFRKKGIIPFCRVSESSLSFYVKPDLILNVIRVSDHENDNHSGHFNIICCKDAPEQVIVQDVDKTTYYATIDNYESIMKDVARKIIFSRDKRKLLSFSYSKDVEKAIEDNKLKKDGKRYDEFNQ